jgi:hypothetical protein
MRFTGIGQPAEFRAVTRAHIIAGRDELTRRGLCGSTIRHRFASLASLFGNNPLNGEDGRAGALWRKLHFNSVAARLDMILSWRLGPIVEVHTPHTEPVRPVPRIAPFFPRGQARGVLCRHSAGR